MSFFSDRTKLRGKVGGGVYCQKLSINFSFRLPDYCSVFRAEVAAIKVALDLLLLSAASFRKVPIQSDIRAAIQDLITLTVRSGLVRECLTSLSMATSHFVIRIASKVSKADELARKGTLAPLSVE